MTREPMPPPKAPALPSSREAEPWTSLLYRYFFYAWLFDDASQGTTFERAAASRRNAEQARWLPTYLLRWLVIAGVLISLERLSERLTGDSLWTAALLISIILAALYCLIIVLCWALLKIRPR